MDSAEKTLGGCFALQIGISIVLTAVLLLWGREALLAFGASENTIDYAADYLHIYAFGTLFVELTLGMNAFITAQGFAKVGMYTVLIGAAANIILDPIFIFALGMGVRGAALATVLSQGLSCAWVLVFLCGKKAFLRLRREISSSRRSSSCRAWRSAWPRSRCRRARASSPCASTLPCSSTAATSPSAP